VETDVFDSNALDSDNAGGAILGSDGVFLLAAWAPARIRLSTLFCATFV
jgi:hypothetical protein